MTATQARRGRAAARAGPGRCARRQRPWALVLALPVVIAIAAVLLGPSGGAAGTLAAERTEHAFGTIRMQDGLLAASFPLAFEGAVEVTDLGTT